MRDTILCLCDLTGIMAKPWVDHGYKAILVDPQHGFDHSDGQVTLLAKTVEEAMPEIQHVISDDSIAFVAAFPPCTDMAVSGARWFESKRLRDPLFQARAVQVAEQCRTICRMSAAPWFVENPRSILSNVFGRPQHTFQPFWYTAYAPEDNYTKLTCLWHDDLFRMPPRNQDLTLGDPDVKRIWFASGKNRGNFRSKTPRGFAEAVYAANRGV